MAMTDMPQQSDQPVVTAEIDLKQIMQMIPHRYPFLMIDKVINVVRGQSAIGVKSVTINEPHFQGHFPRWPVMPGVLIIEAMAQTAAVMVVDAIAPPASSSISPASTARVFAARSCRAARCISMSSACTAAARCGSSKERRWSTAS